MKKILYFFHNLIEEYGIRAFSAVLLFMMMLLLGSFAVILSYTSNTEWVNHLFSGPSVQGFLQRLPVLLNQSVSWFSWIITIGAAFAALYLSAEEVFLSQDDPLFPPKVTLLSFVILARFSWTLPSIRELVRQMIFDTSGICQIILTTMFFGLTAGLFQLLSLQREYRNFRKIENQLVTIHPDAQQQLEQVSRIMAQTRGIFRKKWENMKNVMDYAAHADYETLMSFPNEREILKESKLSFIIKILPILGLIGTVVGFTLAVVGMQSAASSMADFSSFKGNMLEALGGMKTAFLTTLTGMIGMLLVMWISSLLEESRRRILLMEDEFLYIRSFLPWQKHREEKKNQAS